MVSLIQPGSILPVGDQFEAANVRELTITSEELHEMLQATMSVMLLHSDKLHARAYEHYKAGGIGAYVIMFPSVFALESHPPASATYLTLDQLTRLRYRYGCELVDQYNPRTSFVFIVGVVSVRHGTLFGGCIAHASLNVDLERAFAKCGITGEGPQAAALDKLAEEYEDLKRTRQPLQFRRCAREGCTSSSTTMRTCARCGGAYYCSRICQRTDWAARHKRQCAAPPQ
jgi:hypothetical protein